MLNGLYSYPILIAVFMGNGPGALPPGPPAGSFAPQFVGRDVEDESNVRSDTLSDWVTTRLPFEKRGDRPPAKFSSQRFRGCLHTYLHVPGGCGCSLPTIIVYDPSCTSEYEVITLQAKDGTWSKWRESQPEHSWERERPSPFVMVRVIHRPSAVYRTERIEPECGEAQNEAVDFRFDLAVEW